MACGTGHLDKRDLPALPPDDHHLDQALAHLLAAPLENRPHIKPFVLPAKEARPKAKTREGREHLSVPKGR